ncbi:hypothetical protein LZ30DRAFT_583040 [Colletotrichum cereale]|nr:hypothetical protein LZ30DRAFT_583040 [Colletotrichum cereale]
MPHGDDDNDEARRDDDPGAPICVQYNFSQTVPASLGVPMQIRLLSASNDTLVTVHGACDVLAWSLLRNVAPQRIEIDIAMDYVTGIAISPHNSSVIALVFRLGTRYEAWTFDWANQIADAILAPGTDFHSVQYSPDGRLLAWISGEGIDVWEPLLNTHVKTIRESKKRTNGLPTARFAFTPDSRRIATVDRSGRLVTWDVASWSCTGESKPKRAWDEDGREVVQLVAGKGRVIVVSCEIGERRTWRLTTWWPDNGGRAGFEMNGCAYGCVPQDGRFIATVQLDGGKLRIRDSNSGVCLDQSTQGIAKVDCHREDDDMAVAGRQIGLEATAVPKDQRTTNERTNEWMRTHELSDTHDDDG